MVYSTPNKTRKQQAKQYKMDHTGRQILDCHQHLQLFTKLLVATWCDARAKIKFNIHVRSTQGKAVLHKLSQDLQSVLEVQLPNLFFLTHTLSMLSLIRSPLDNKIDLVALNP